MAVEEVQSESESFGETYEETTAKRYPVAPGVALNVAAVRHQLPADQGAPDRRPGADQLPEAGEWVSGPYGTSNIWDNIANGQFVCGRVCEHRKRRLCDHPLLLRGRRSRRG